MGHSAPMPLSAFRKMLKNINIKSGHHARPAFKGIWPWKSARQIAHILRAPCPVISLWWLPSLNDMSMSFGRKRSGWPHPATRPRKDFLLPLPKKIPSTYDRQRHMPRSIDGMWHHSAKYHLISRGFPGVENKMKSFLLRSEVPRITIYHHPPDKHTINASW